MSGSTVSARSSAEEPASSASQHQQPRKLTALERNNLEWESRKEEIHNVYIGQDKTLKETMQWFKETRGLDWSERKWKEKMKEWEFDKNIPAKEMAFMASKARKRQLDESKETVFRRNGVVVDQIKVENFKKQKLLVNGIGEGYLPQTPQHISYETPKPVPIDQSTFSEIDYEEHTPNPRLLLETVDESDLTEGNISTNPVGQIPAPTSSTEELDIDPSESSQEIPRPSESMDDQNVCENLGCPQATSIAGPTRKRSSRTVSEVLHDRGEMFNTSGDLSHLRLEKLKNDMKFAYRLLNSWERESAGAEYCIAIRSYINAGGDQDDPMFMDSVAQVVKYFKTCNRNQLRTSASQCLELLQILNNKSLIPSCARRLVSSELERLLHLLLGHQPKLNLDQIIFTLSKWGWSENLHLALQSFLRGSAQPPEDSSMGDKRFNQLRLLLHLLALGLKELLGDGFSSWLALVADDLHNAMLHAQRLGYSSGNGHGLFAHHTIEACFSLKHLLRASDKQWIIDQENFDALQELATSLASQCSVSGWYDQAETLFDVLRSTPIHDRASPRDPRKYSSTGLRKSRITFQYCLHLERQKRYEQLLAVIRDEYTELLTDQVGTRSLTNDMSVEAEVRKEILKLRAILINIPSGGYIFSGLAFEIIKLINRLEEVTPIYVGWAENLTQAVDKDRFQRMEVKEEEDLDDCKSSNKYGITYTESVVTGLSLNYSGLHG